MRETDWKLKYKNILSKYMNGIELAFQKGYKKGLQEAQIEQMQEQQAQAEEAAAAAGGIPGQDPEELNAEQQDIAAATGEEGAPTELDTHLTEMENLVAKSKGKLGIELKKTLEKMKADTKMLNKSLYKDSKLKETQDMFKKTTGKSAPKTLSTQASIVKNMVASWEDKSSEASSEIEEILKKK